MRYLRSYRYLFDSPSWGLNLLAGAACQFVPVLGPIVFTGYAFEMIDAIPESGDGECPVFDRNRLGPYLLRGLWPFVVQMAVLLPVLFVAWIVSMLLLTAVSGEGSTGPRVTLGLLLPVVVMVVIGLSILVAPLTLYVGLRQDLVGSPAFAKDFLQRVGRETVLAQTFLGVTGLSVTLMGGSLCCAGVYPAAALVHFAQYHLLAQLYGLYLRRGGEQVRAEKPPALPAE